MKETSWIITMGLMMAAIIIVLTGTFTISPYVIGANNSTVTTRVNVSNTPPTLYSVEILDAPIDLTPGTTTEVVCHGEVYDQNGYDDITYVNATLFDTTNGYAHGDADDKNYHYTNASCEACTQLATDNASCNCSFSVEYYANNASWSCNMTVKDANFTSNESASGVFNPVLGLSTPSEIDYGDVAVAATSAEQEVNITNYGNIQMNLSVWGFGGDNFTIGNNLSMICTTGNITVTNERYDTIQGENFNDMINLSNESAMVSGFILNQRTNDSNIEYGDDLNITYWMFQVPYSVSGTCNGTVVFEASDSTL